MGNDTIPSPHDVAREESEEMTRHTIPFRVAPLVATAALTITAFAYQGGSSPIEGTVLPGGGTRLNDRALGEKMGHFFNDMARDFKLPQDNSKSATVFLWTGDNYQSGRGVFLRTSFKKSLESAGYTYREMDIHDVVTNIWAQEYGLGATDEDTPRKIVLSAADTICFFITTHTASGRTYIGLWVDQIDAQQCALLVGQVGSKKPAKMAPLPPVTGANTLLVKNPLNAMEGITPPKNPTFSSVTPRSGYARGWVKDMAGRPLAGANISFKSSAIGGLQSTVTAKSNAQGFYEVVLPQGACRLIEADYVASYNNLLYRLPLHVVDGDRDVFNAREGHVENLVLRTWGVANQEGIQQDPRHGDSYYGAFMRVQWFNDDVPEAGTVEITLKPVGAMLGPDTPRTLVFRLPARQSTLSADYFLNNIPIGRYTMTTRLLSGTDEMPLRSKIVYDSSEPVESRQVDFKPFSATYASMNRSGIARYDFTLKP